VQKPEAESLERVRNEVEERSKLCDSDSDAEVVVEEQNDGPISNSISVAQTSGSEASGKRYSWGIQDWFNDKPKQKDPLWLIAQLTIQISATNTAIFTYE